MIKDEFTNLSISRQMKKQLRYKRDGLCVICGSKRSKNSKNHCMRHQEMINKLARKNMRVYLGIKPENYRIK